jgi:dTDP-4-dehydrorhamnose reductase
VELKGKRILILGCGGMLGQAVYHSLKGNNIVLATDIDLNEEWLSFLDVNDKQAMYNLCLEFKPDYLINLAANTNLEHCENNPELCFQTNSIGQENVCKVANQLGIIVVYVSTASIFNGNKPFYSESDLASPLSIYGKSKYQGEVITRQTVSEYFILRAGWMMGGGKRDKKFVKLLIDQIKDGKTNLSVVNDKIGSITYTWDFAKNLSILLQNGKFGTYNMVNEGPCSRNEIAAELLDILCLKDRITLSSVNSGFFKKQYQTPRPSSEVLKNDALNHFNLNFMRDWKTCLKEYATSLYAEKI